MPLIPDLDPFQDYFEKPLNQGMDTYQAQRLFKSNFDLQVAPVFHFLAHPKAVNLSREHYKIYSSLPRVALTPKQDLLRATILNVLENRRTHRDFDADFVMPRSTLSTLLHYAAGLQKPYRAGVLNLRFYPSPGALYSHEIYVLSLRDNFAPPGLYHYNVRDSVLERMKDIDPAHVFDHICVKEDPEKIKAASTVIIMTCVFERSTKKYGRRGWKFLQYETGVILQNFYWVAGALGLGVWPMGNLVEDDLLPLLGIDGVQEGFMTSLWLGAPKHQTSRELSSKYLRLSKLISDFGKSQRWAKFFSKG